MPNVIEIEETFFGRTDGRTFDDLIPALLGRIRRVDLNIKEHKHSLWESG